MLCDKNLIRKDITKLDERFETFTCALAAVRIIIDQMEACLFEQHLIAWSKHYGWVKRKAELLITYSDITVDVHSLHDKNEDCGVSASSQLRNLKLESTGDKEDGRLGQYLAMPAQGRTFVMPVTSTSGKSGAKHVVDSGVNSKSLERTEIDPAIWSVRTELSTLEEDIEILNQEVAITIKGGSCTTVYLAELKEYCGKIEIRLITDVYCGLKELVKLGTYHDSQELESLKEKIIALNSQLQLVQSQIRIAFNHATNTVSGTGLTVREETKQPVGHYVEPLNPPRFSGKLEDWSDFRNMWDGLYSDYPEKVQVLYFKESIPPSDRNRVAGVSSMSELWNRLDSIYGDKTLNITSIKSKLESLALESTLEHDQVIEVYQAVERAVTQLESIGAVEYMNNDLALINNLLMKLPYVDRRQYADHLINSEGVTNPHTRWETFWSWLRKKHDSALQVRIMFICDQSSGS